MEDPTRARVHGHDHSVLAIGPGVGYAVCVVEAADHAALTADPLIDSIPAHDLSVRVSELSRTERAELNKMAARRGIKVSGELTLRDVVDRLGRRIDPEFNKRSWGV